MTPRDLIVDVLLALGVGAELICCIGVLLMRNALAPHFEEVPA